MFLQFTVAFLAFSATIYIKNKITLPDAGAGQTGSFTERRCSVLPNKEVRRLFIYAESESGDYKKEATI